MDFVSALDYRDSFTNLYLAAFPPEERRDADAVFDMARSRPEFACHALRLDGAFAGLLTAWHLEGFDYVEHFAVEPHLRGRNLGGDAIDAFVALHDRPVVLEVEPPHAGGASVSMSAMGSSCADCPTSSRHIRPHCLRSSCG